ncbi:MAG: hypothetical protein AVDCRST_MAG86-4210 [uncultured Truepera sp.]|uniref:Uncharacterized protein n=1 Tax=uncultured Truepera sp. TaxID=543023 RepID=A0A6J4VU66_9DEIN|nr:MAG: hypothetical protein AVDCRST_MAG86-4210 [uncultured Truepera sp.]
MMCRRLTLSALVTTLICSASAFAAAPEPLANLSHLDFLTVPVTPPEGAGHSTYRLDEEPELLALWTYAEPLEDGSGYRHVGGGDYDAATDTWSQGAFNADDLTRAAVVYLRHWRASGEESSRASAYELLRTVAYLQTVTKGPSEGNVVLWMQPDGTLNPSAEPVELPDPSDSGASYWLARTVWAFGEGYAAFAEGATRAELESWQLVEAESGTLTGGEVVTPEGAWNGEANWSGGAYVTLPPGGELSVEVPLPTAGRYAVLPVFERQPVNLFAAGADISLGGQTYRLAQGGAGDPGVSPNEGLLTVALAKTSGQVQALDAGTTSLTATATGDSVNLDAFLVRPEVARLGLSGDTRQTLLQSFAPQRRVVSLDSWLLITTYDGAGNPTGTVVEAGSRVPVRLIRREPVSFSSDSLHLR